MCRLVRRQRALLAAYEMLQQPQMVCKHSCRTFRHSRIPGVHSQSRHQHLSLLKTLTVSCACRLLVIIS